MMLSKHVIDIGKTKHPLIKKFFKHQKNTKIIKKTLVKLKIFFSFKFKRINKGNNKVNIKVILLITKNIEKIAIKLN